MKTFTNYAEKKAKQFLNLLQGYTKGIRLTAILILLLMGVSNVWAGHGFFNDDACGIKLNYSGNTTTEIKKNSSGASTHALGTITKLYLKGWWFAAWENTDDFKGNESGKLYYRVYLAGSPSGNYTSTTHAYYSWGGWNNGSQNVWLGTDNLNTNILNGLVGGNYIFEYYFTMGSEYLSNGSKNYTISFTYNPTYTVTVNAGTGGSVAKNSIVAGNITEQTLPTATPNTGYSFANWTITNGDLTLSSATSPSDATVKARSAGTVTANFTPTEYTITYKDQNNATFSGAHADGHPTTHTYGTATTLKDPTKDGYTFDGWFTNSDCTGTAIESLGATAYTADITLYAKWTRKQSETTLLTIKSDLTGACKFTVNGVENFPNGNSVEVGTDKSASIEVTVNNGYRFNGFTTEGNIKVSATHGQYGIEVVSNGNGGSGTVTAQFVQLLSTETIYLKPGGWSSDNARFAVYVYNATENKWIDMAPVGCTGYYKTKEIIDAKYTGITFYRMDPTKTENVWANRWNQTAGKDFDGTWNCFEHTTWGNVGDNGYQGGEDCSGNYTTYTPSDPTITLSNGANGVLSVKTMDDVEIKSGSTVAMDTRVVVTVTPNVGYMISSAKIKIGDTEENIESGKTYTICNNTTITTSYTEAGEWYVFGTMNQWKAEERHKIVNGKAIVSLNGDTEYKFKIVQVKGESKTYYGKEWTVTGLNNTIESLSSADRTPDCKINTVHKGDYIFEWDANPTKLIVTYPNMCFIRGDFDGWKDRASHALHDRDAQVYLEKNKTYYFKVVEQGVYYTDKTQHTALLQKTGDKKTMNDKTSYGTNDPHNCGIKATITGIYKFHFDRTTRELTVTYPTEDKTLAAGDYRLKFVNGTNDHVSDHVKKGDGQDTVSMFITKAGTNSRIILQKYSGSSWTNVNGQSHSLSDMSAVQKDTEMTDKYGGVWNFIIKQTNGGANAEVIIDKTHPERYTGNYYIRTDGAGGGWNEYMIPENVMPFASYPRDNGKGFDHYFCEWILDKTNVNYNIANDYCSKLCPNDYTDDTYTTDKGHLQADANVRFMWDSRTNKMKGRAYLSGASTPESRFLVLQGDAYLKDADGKNFEAGTDDNGRKGLGAHEAILSDKQNWVYQLDVKASNNTYVNLIAKYLDIDQYFEGGSEDNEKVPLIKATKDDDYKIRLIYNFKTDHLVRAWLVGDVTIENEETLGADMMIIRRNQEQAQQLKFDPKSSTLSKVKTVFAVTTFSKDFITNDEKSQYERALYWVSFPFDVRISDVFGFGEYGDHWIIQYYDGAARAKYGLFEDSGTYWKYILDPNTKLEKNKGYVLTLDLDRVKGSFLHGTKEVSLYFPSTVELEEITGQLPKEVIVEEHTCTIKMPDATPENKRDRTKYDSHWNMIGVPVFADIENFPTTPGCVGRDDQFSFYYEYLPGSNRYSATNVTTNFQTLYGYMVQFAGTINWYLNQVEVPRSIAAHRNGESELPEKVVLGLELLQGEEKVDQTFVQLQQEGVTTDFDMNIDLTKIINSGANIYTLTNDRIQTAGNALPMDDALVPVGVQIAAEGEYTFRMPDGTEGMVVELIDYEAGTTTNMLLSDYTVTLSKGTHENRFALHVQPSKSGVTTGVGNIGDEAKSIEKYLIDGKLIIRTAEGIFDAQGHRL